MSHEIRTPINTIIGLNEMILRDDITDEIAENAIHIQDASKMLLALINDILDMSRIESGKMIIKKEEFSFRDFVVRYFTSSTTVSAGTSSCQGSWSRPRKYRSTDAK